MKRWMVLLLMTLSLAMSCGPLGPSNQTHQLDGGALIYQGHETYWESEDFPLLVLIDDQMDAEKQDAVFRAVLEWHDVLGFDVFEPVIVDFSEPASRTNGLISVSARELGVNSLRGTEILGLHQGRYEPNSGHKLSAELWFDTDVPSHQLIRVMVHELGHALCLAHDDSDSRSIMYWSATHQTYQWIMPDDALWVRRMRFGAYIPSTADSRPSARLLLPFRP